MPRLTPALVASGVLLALTAGCSGEPEPDVGTSFGAEDICETFVERQLKAPSTADYSGVSSSEQPDGSFVVIGAVDAENSFGAMIRGNFYCEVAYEGDGNWSPVDIQVD